jgi:hypothetical protein
MIAKALEAKGGYKKLVKHSFLKKIGKRAIFFSKKNKRKKSGKTYMNFEETATELSN